MRNKFNNNSHMLGGCFILKELFDTPIFALLYCDQSVRAQKCRAILYSFTCKQCGLGLESYILYLSKVNELSISNNCAYVISYASPSRCYTWA